MNPSTTEFTMPEHLYIYIYLHNPVQLNHLVKWLHKILSIQLSKCHKHSQVKKVKSTASLVVYIYFTPVTKMNIIDSEMNGIFYKIMKLC